MTEPGGLPTFDIESVNWINPIAVGFYDGYEYHEFIRESESDDIIWRFLCFLRERFQGGKVYAHCASKFDNYFILSSLYQHGETAVPEAGLIRLRWKGPNICFEDSYLIAPMSLKSLNKMLGVEEKGTWEHEAGLTPDKMGSKLDTFRAYLKNDCLSLSHALYELCGLLGTTFGVMPSISLSTTAAKIFDKCFYSLDDIYPNEEFDGFLRQATYGGRNEVYKRYGEDIDLYDVKSMYVSCYDTPVPIGKLRWVRPNIDRGTLAEAQVKIPRGLYVSPLPFKPRDLRGQLAFPVGELQGWWDTKELKNAAENFGVDVTIKRQLYCEEEPVLEGFGKMTSNLRGGSKDIFWKILGLSLSGKFGQSRWRTVIRYASEIRNFQGYFPIDRDETYFQALEYIKGNHPYIRPAIAMRVRAEARIRHLRHITEALNQGKLFYCDTDSIYTTTKLPHSTSPKCGELVKVGHAERGYFIRQKLYGVVIEGSLVQRSSGYSDLKLTEEDFIALLEGKRIPIQSGGFPSYKSVFSRGELVWIERSRGLKAQFDSNRILEEGDSRPLVITRRD